jgi:hypothetical protein
MALPGINITTVDGNLALTRPNPERVLVIGTSSAGVADRFYTFAQVTACVEALGRGPAVTAACHVIERAGVVDVLKITGSVEASVSAVDKTGPGGTVAISGTPSELFLIHVVIVVGGDNGVARFRYTLDGVTFSALRTVPTGGSFVVPDSGLTLTFDDTAPFVAGTTYDAIAFPATFDGNDLDDASDALLAVPNRWKAILWAFLADTTENAATLAAQIGAVHASMADQARMSRALLPVGGVDDEGLLAFQSENATPAGHAAAMSTFGGNVRGHLEDYEDIRVACFAGVQRMFVSNKIEGWHQPYVPISYSAAGRVARFTRATNIGWVGAGRLTEVTKITFDERVAGEQLHDIGVNTTRTHIGRPGYYFTNGLLKAPVGSDFRYLSWGLTFDLIAEVTHDALLPFINSTVRVNSDGGGTIHPFDAARIEGVVNAAIRVAVLEPLNEQGFKGLVSAAEFTVDRTHNILSTKKLLGNVRAVPLANIEQMDVTAGFFTALASVDVTAEAA